MLGRPSGVVAAEHKLGAEAGGQKHVDVLS